MIEPVEINLSDLIKTQSCDTFVLCLIKTALVNLAGPLKEPYPKIYSGRIAIHLDL